MAQFELWRPSPVERRGRSSDCELFLFQEGGTSRREFGRYKKEPCYLLLLQTNLSFKLTPQHTEKTPRLSSTSRFKQIQSLPTKAKQQNGTNSHSREFGRIQQEIRGQLHPGPPRSPTSKEICRLYDSSPLFPSRLTSR
jgi:hypothetical protein